MSQKYGHCPVPNCERRLISGKHPHGLCIHHEELLDFLLFILPRIKPSPGAAKASGLVLPGQPGFTVSTGGIKQEIEKQRSVKHE